MTPEQHYLFEAQLWRDPGATWFFITVPDPVSAQIRFMAGGVKGFGTVRVDVRLGESRWKTSLFPDKASGCYFLPVKADIRRAERISHGDRVSVELRIS
ncbi:DUF1905 domain-containing protein [uncultured Hoeflea sp.]|uniref:DUF1905 domain-containing protein n=1 Tax=uncultured Hoeflea sp. TaxID=538666 RepID=UPI002630474A|nr:DUF1905 domain-containing protein [uncultured Hoeflea sp.]